LRLLFADFLNQPVTCVAAWVCVEQPGVLWLAFLYQGAEDWSLRLEGEVEVRSGFAAR
jgi:hypothetical protein